MKPSPACRKVKYVIKSRKKALRNGSGHGRSLAYDGKERTVSQDTKDHGVGSQMVIARGPSTSYMGKS